MFVSCIWWQVHGVGNTETHFKMSSYLLNTCIHVRSKLNVWMWLSSLPLLPVTGAHLEVLVRSVFWLMRWWKLVNCGSSEYKFPLLLCQDILAGSSFGTEWSGARSYGGVKEWTETIRLFQCLFSLCHLGSRSCWCNTVLQLKLSNAKWRLYVSLWHGQTDKEGLQSTWIDQQSLALALHVLPANVATGQPVLRRPAVLCENICFLVIKADACQLFRPWMILLPKACTLLSFHFFLNKTKPVAFLWLWNCPSAIFHVTQSYAFYILRYKSAALS